MRVDAWRFFGASSECCSWSPGFSLQYGVNRIESVMQPKGCTPTVASCVVARQYASASGARLRSQLPHSALRTPHSKLSTSGNGRRADRHGIAGVAHLQRQGNGGPFCRLMRTMRKCELTDAPASNTSSDTAHQTASREGEQSGAGPRLRRTARTVVLLVAGSPSISRGDQEVLELPRVV